VLPIEPLADGLSDWESYGVSPGDLSGDTGSAPACGMPVSVQAERLERVLLDRFGSGFVILSTDLLGVQGREREAVLDALVAGELSPIVLVEGEMVCAGAVEPFVLGGNASR
jgi:hypothetical protein